jgi:hypothetical protein
VSGSVYKETRIRSLDTHIALEHVQECDVVCSEAGDKRTADAVLLRSELPSENRLASLARNNSGVILGLNKKTSKGKSAVRGEGPRDATLAGSRYTRSPDVVRC